VPEYRLNDFTELLCDLRAGQFDVLVGGIGLAGGFVGGGKEQFQKISGKGSCISLQKNSPPCQKRDKRLNSYEKICYTTKSMKWLLCVLCVFLALFAVHKRELNRKVCKVRKVRKVHAKNAKGDFMLFTV